MRTAPRELIDRLQKDLRSRLERNPLLWIEGPRGVVPLKWHAGQVDAWQRQAAVKLFGAITGNRWGKTVWGAARTAETALGIPRCDWPLLPARPREWRLGPARLIWAVTTTFEKSRDVQQRALWERIPRPLWQSRYHESTGFNNRVGLLVNGSKVVFKSCEQKLRTFEGDRIDLAWIDETIPTRYFLAILPRTVDRAGPIVWTSIPDDPLLEDLFVRRAFDPATKEILGEQDVDWVGGTMRDNPHLGEGEIALLERLLPSDERAVRIKGQFAGRRRLVYADFSEALHLRNCDPPLPAVHQANRVEIIDPGWSVPCAVLFCALEPGNVYGIYDEIYRRRRTVGQIAAEIFLRRWIWRGLMTPGEIAEYRRLTDDQDAEGRELTPEQQIRRDRLMRTVIEGWRMTKGDQRPRMTLVDESAKQRDQSKPVSFVSQLRAFGIQGRAVSNRDKDGQRREVRQLLRPAGGLVRLWLAPRCEWSIWEFQHFRERPGRAEVGEHEGDRERVVEVADHAMNCIEYLAAEAPKFQPLGREAAPVGSVIARHAELVETGRTRRSLRRG